MRLILACLLFSAFALPAAAGEPGARTIVLVRHGHYAADPAADPKLGPGLTPFGVTQARQVGARVAAD